MDTFRAFSGLHAAALGAIALLTAIAIVVARRRAPSPHATPTERAIGWAYLAAWATTFTFLASPPLLEPAKTYPLQLCHLNALAAALLLITRWRVLRPIVYFWGFALSTQALITPTLTEGPAIYPFWFFWTTHGMIVGVALYDVIALHYRPALRDYGIACAASAAYSRLSCRSTSRSAGTTGSWAPASRRCPPSSIFSGRGPSDLQSSYRWSPR
ncbi:MAG: TIGR02206 family membrane protein [Burkholderiales bacterium]